MKRTSHITLAAMILSASVSASVASAFAQTFVPVTEAMLASPDPADWLMMNRTFDEQRFSPLSQINTSNVAQLRMAWSRGLPNGTQESTPIVYRGVMYLYAPGASIQAVRVWQSAPLSRHAPSGVMTRWAENAGALPAADLAKAWPTPRLPSGS